MILLRWALGALGVGPKLVYRSTRFAENGLGRTSTVADATGGREVLRVWRSPALKDGAKIKSPLRGCDWSGWTLMPRGPASSRTILLICGKAVFRLGRHGSR
jgi:hypothetical protein